MKKYLVVSAIEYCKGFKRRIEEVLPVGTRYYINENGIGTIITGNLSVLINVIADNNEEFAVMVNDVLDAKNAEWVVNCYFCGCAKITA